MIPATVHCMIVTKNPVLTAKQASIPDMTTTESLEPSAAEETESSTGTISNSVEETSLSYGKTLTHDKSDLRCFPLKPHLKCINWI